MKIEVMKEDIDSGIPDNTCECPIALAIKRQTGNDVVVDFEYGFGAIAHVGNDSYFLPKSCERFIRKFDVGDIVKPFFFDLK